MSDVRAQAQKAKEASFELSKMDSNARENALIMMADALLANTDAILEANAKDMDYAREKGTSSSLLDRLMLDRGRINDIATALCTLARESDPIGEIVGGHRLSNGIELKQVRVPLGVVAMIYEARPNVTADAAGLCIKTGNACVLRGGSLAINSTIAMGDILYKAALDAGMPKGCIQVIATTDRSATEELMKLHGLIDVLIPRGGAGLIRNCVENSKVPVIETGVGNCHIYLHKDADPSMAKEIVINAKCQRPGVCNAAESLLVDDEAAETLLPQVIKALNEKGVEMHGDKRTVAIGDSVGVKIVPAGDDEWGKEYLGMEISIKTVSGVEEAIEHINTYGTRHSEAIVSENYSAVEMFLNEVDAAAVYANASTRFTDGGEFGLGAELGISTQKLHARGPMGLAALTSTKYILTGKGHVRS